MNRTGMEDRPVGYLSPTWERTDYELCDRCQRPTDHLHDSGSLLVCATCARAEAAGDDA